MRYNKFPHQRLVMLAISIPAIFLVRALLAVNFDGPHTSDLFDTITIFGSAIIVWQYRRRLSRMDWGLALILGFIIGIEMRFATHFSPYPFWGVIKTTAGQAVIRSVFTSIAVLGGLTIIRLGGPVAFHLVNRGWTRAGKTFLLGLLIGLPLAVANVFALQATQGQSIQWQNPLTALADALQPGIVEEVIYRLRCGGLFWLFLRTSLPDKAVWISRLLAMLVHNFSHFDDLFIQSSLVALGMGGALALVWGVPPLILARYKGLESAIAFHWIQDGARFVAGY